MQNSFIYNFLQDVVTTVWQDLVINLLMLHDFPQMFSLQSRCVYSEIVIFIRKMVKSLINFQFLNYYVDIQMHTDNCLAAIEL